MTEREACSWAHREIADTGTKDVRFNVPIFNDRETIVANCDLRIEIAIASRMISNHECYVVEYHGICAWLEVAVVFLQDEGSLRIGSTYKITITYGNDQCSARLRHLHVCSL